MEPRASPLLNVFSTDGAVRTSSAWNKRSNFIQDQFAPTSRRRWSLKPRPFPSSDYLRLWPDSPRNILLEPVVFVCHTPALPVRRWHMATQPSRDNPSGPDTESSQSENIQELESVLVLRTAKSLILPLRIPDQWQEQPLPTAAPSRSTGASPIVSFKAT